MLKERRKIKPNGFTLIELMISICIIGIAIAIAIPIYNTSIVKARLTSSLGLMAYHRPHIVRHYSITGSMPKTQSDYLQDDILPGDDGATESIQSDNGVLTATSKEKFETGANYELSLQPALWESEYENPRIMLWNCGTKTPPTGARPLGVNNTNVPSNYLPSTCRN